MNPPLQHFDIRLTPQELDQIANTLAQQPWHQVNALLTNIKSQIDMQQKIAAMPQTGELRARNATPFGPNGETAEGFIKGGNGLDPDVRPVN